MKSNKRSALRDPEMLFTLITALIKNAGGEIRISEDEMDAVTKSDVVFMYWDKSSEEIILSLEFLAGGRQDPEVLN